VEGERVVIDSAINALDENINEDLTGHQRDAMRAKCILTRSLAQEALVGSGLGFIQGSLVGYSLRKLYHKFQPFIFSQFSCQQLTTMPGSKGISRKHKSRQTLSVSPTNSLLFLNIWISKPRKKKPNHLFWYWDGDGGDGKILLDNVLPWYGQAVEVANSAAQMFQALLTG
jgi:hypothetical protein